MSKTALVIGGSNSGLMNGIMLKHHGYDVTILEQDPSSARQGSEAGGRLGCEVLAFLAEHDRTGIPATVSCVLARSVEEGGGRDWAALGTRMRMTNWGLLVRILRANFDGSRAAGGAKEGGDGKAVFKGGYRVVDVADLGEKVRVWFEDEQTGEVDSCTADIVIAADGTHSTVRGILMPEVERQYAGYYCWRGTVTEEAVEEKSNRLLTPKCYFHWMERNYLLYYTIPTMDGDMEPGKRAHNWLWYNNMAEDSQEHEDLMTDINGQVHKGSMPRGLVREEIWQRQKAIAAKKLPKALAEVVQKTQQPFVSKIYDVFSPRASFFGGKLFMVGDALITLRPNSGMSTTQAAYHCRLLEKVIKSEITADQWNREVLRYGKAQRWYAITLATLGLGSRFQLLVNASQWLLILIGQKLRIM